MAFLEYALDDPPDDDLVELRGGDPRRYLGRWYDIEDDLCYCYELAGDNYLRRNPGEHPQVAAFWMGAEGEWLMWNPEVRSIEGTSPPPWVKKLKEIPWPGLK